MIKMLDGKTHSAPHQAETAERIAPDGSLRGRNSAIVLSFTFIAALIAILQNLLGPGLALIFKQPDASWYMNIANGETSKTIQPFVWRQLAPLISRAIAFLFHINLTTAFFWLGIVYLVALLTIVAILLVPRAPRVFLLVSIAGLALWATLFLSLMLPDLLNATLLACLLLLLDRRHYLAASLMLFPMFISRESTVLVLVCLLAAGWKVFKRRDMGVAVIASLAGRLTVGALTANSLSNREQVSPLIYLIGKIPWNFALNIGFPLWSSKQSEFCAVPHGVISVHLGGITSIGFCPFQPYLPLTTLRYALGIFGLLPLLFIFLWRKGLPAIKTESPLMRFCLFYGVASFLLAPFIGHSLERLFGYAWPLFVIYVPSVAMRKLTLGGISAIAFLVLHFALTWSNEMIIPYYYLNLELTLFCLYAAAYLCGWIIVSKSQTQVT